MFRRISSIVALCAFLFAFSTVNGAGDNLGTTPGPVYTVIDIGMLPDGEQMFPTALSDTGFVVGVSQQQDGADTAFYYHPSIGLVNAGYDDSTHCFLRDVNNRGEAVGEVGTFLGGGYSVYAYEFTPAESSATDLFGGYCEIRTINDSGMYAGRAEGEGFPMQAIRYLPGLGWEGLKKPGMGYTAVSEINERGVIIGYATYGTGVAFATLWDQYGNAMEITIHGYDWSTGIAINDHNDCVVVANKFVGTELSIAHSFVVSSGGAIDIGTLGGNSCLAEAINNAGTVVGVSYDVNGNGHGFVYRDGEIRNLNSLIDRTDCHIDYAVDVNNRGVILAKANGERAVLLVPNHH